MTTTQTTNSTDDKKRITEWLDPFKSTVCTGCNRPSSKYGPITNSEWLNREMERINKGSHKCVRLTEENSEEYKQALFYVDGYYDNGIWVCDK